ncbi:MAG: RnfH family protein [Pseudomonadota bacterium]
MDKELKIEVAYARPDLQKIIELKVAVGTTILDAVRQSKIVEYFPEIDLARNKVGVFGKLAKPEAVLRDQDRVEIYRLLIADPKESRRKRAERGKQKKRM